MKLAEIVSAVLYDTVWQVFNTSENIKDREENIRKSYVFWTTKYWEEVEKAVGGGAVIRDRGLFFLPLLMYFLNVRYFTDCILEENSSALCQDRGRT